MTTNTNFFRRQIYLIAYRAVLVMGVLLTALPSFAERIIFSANSMSGTAGNSSDKTTLRGNAYVLTASMEIAADAITMSGKNFRYIEADGNITGKNFEAKMEFTCGKLSYDRETKIATLRDSVYLEDTENNVTAEAEIIEYNQNTDTAIIQIDITLKQKDNICKSVYAVYRKKAQLLELSGNSHITQGQDTFRAQEITLNLETQEITLDGRVKGSVIDSRGEQSENTDENESEQDAKVEARIHDESATKQRIDENDDTTHTDENNNSAQSEQSNNTTKITNGSSSKIKSSGTTLTKHSCIPYAHTLTQSATQGAAS